MQRVPPRARTRPPSATAEMLIEIRIPIRAGAGSAYEKVERRAGDWAVAAAGAAVRLDGRDDRRRRRSGWPRSARDVTAPGAEARRSSASRRPRRRSPRPAGSPPRTATRPTDQRGPVDYKRHLAAELTAARAAPGRRPGDCERRPDMQVTMTVNGEESRREVEPRLLLVHFLRDELGLTGTHWGCDTSQLRHLRRADGRRAGEVLHGARRDGRRARGPHRRGPRAATACSTRCSRASSRSTACSAASARPGMMLTARALLDRNPRPDRRRDPRGDLRPDLPLHRLREHRPRRSAGPPSTRRSRRPTAEDGLTDDRQRRAAATAIGFGRMQRKEDARFIRGQGHYVDDVKLPGHAARRRSCAARSRTPGSSRSTPPRPWRTRRCTPSSPAQDLDGAGPGLDADAVGTTCRPCWPPTRCASRARRSRSSSPTTATPPATRSS